MLLHEHPQIVKYIKLEKKFNKKINEDSQLRIKLKNTQNCYHEVRYMMNCNVQKVLQRIKELWTKQWPQKWILWQKFRKQEPWNIVRLPNANRCDPSLKEILQKKKNKTKKLTQLFIILQYHQSFYFSISLWNSYNRNFTVTLINNLRTYPWKHDESLWDRKFGHVSRLLRFGIFSTVRRLLP